MNVLRRMLRVIGDTDRYEVTVAVKDVIRGRLMARARIPTSQLLHDCGVPQSQLPAASSFVEALASAIGVDADVFRPDDSFIELLTISVDDIGESSARALRLMEKTRRYDPFAYDVADVVEKHAPGGLAAIGSHCYPVPKDEDETIDRLCDLRFRDLLGLVADRAGTP